MERRPQCLILNRLKLGIVLEEVGLLRWNGETKGIKWQIVAHDKINVANVREMLEDRIALGPAESPPLHSEKPKDEVGYTIDDHKHNFAVWAAARAAQRGFTTLANLSKAANDSRIREMVVEINRPGLTPEEFDRWHRDLCSRIIRFLDTVEIENATYGRAAKFVAIYLKVVVVIGGDSICPLAKVAHPPIDRILLQNAARINSNLRDFSNVNWTGLSEAEYFDVIRRLRNQETGEPFWKLEKYWTPTIG